MEEEFPPLLDEIVVAGARAVVAAIKRKSIAPVDFEERATRQRERTTRLQEAAREVVQRVQIGGAVVEYLDKMLVGGKPLGDCAQADLRREEKALRDRGQSLFEQANLLWHIMEHVGPNETVRTASKRAAILDVLRHHFGE